MEKDQHEIGQKMSSDFTERACSMKDFDLSSTIAAGDIASCISSYTVRAVAMVGEQTLVIGLSE